MSESKSLAQTHKYIMNSNEYYITIHVHKRKTHKHEQTTYNHMLQIHKHIYIYIDIHTNMNSHIYTNMDIESKAISRFIRHLMTSIYKCRSVAFRILQLLALPPATLLKAPSR